jgi:plastocyanin
MVDPMGRLMTIAVLVAVIAGAVTIAAGGVDPRHKPNKVAVAAHNADTATPPNAGRPHAKVGAVETMRGLAFTHPRIRVTAGRAVRFVNHDDVEHTVYASIGSDDGTLSFNSRRIQPGHSYTSPELVDPGVYGYVCTLHPTVMTGVIEVTR